ncbi:MAG: methyltransferase domain-containing protein [Proteobacteria bacterium]|nr:methyltransferase domain-containing protein [Burkholderiales bacterium]
MTNPIDFGGLRRLAPLDDHFGLGRGRPVDRHYIENFIARHAPDVRGRVLEVGDAAYTLQFGAERVSTSNILQADSGNEAATHVADLASGEGLPGDAFDCLICTQTLQYVYPLAHAIATIHRILAPGGVLLLTVPGISQISPYDRDRWGEYWRFTAQTLERLLGSAFDDLEINTCGNVLSAVAFLHGMACEDLTEAELDHSDTRYPVLITARAVKAGQAFGAPP